MLSDIHANLEALEAILNATEGEYDQVVVLGDLVDYGPDPDAVVRRLLLEKALCLMGNHDAAVLGKYPLTHFRESVIPATIWTRQTLQERTRSFLDSLPLQLELDGALLVHASVQDPLAGYILTPWMALAQFRATEHQVVFFGHTHLTKVFVFDAGKIGEATPENGQTLSLEHGKRYLINPGGAGQPRNRDPRAPVAIWDSERSRVSFFRIPYDYETTQKKIRSRGLPSYLADRLALGE